jgi:hypothetical protein
MEIKAHFNNISSIIIDNLRQAKTEIKIAVAWFTNKDIFDVLVSKASKIPVHLIIINDDINNRIDGLDFQKFINAKGFFYFAQQQTPMHNKFCLIDGQILITGSCNYTYMAESVNNENIVVFNGCSDIIENYLMEFERIINKNEQIENIKDYLELYSYQKGSYYYKNYGIRDIQAHLNLLKKRNLFDANLLLKKLEHELVNIPDDAFQINDVVYRQWQSDYYVDKICVEGNELVLFYRTIIDDSCWIHGPKTKQPWTLRNSSRVGALCKSYKISNICLDGDEIIKSIESEEFIYFSRNGRIEYYENQGYKKNEKNRPIKANGEIVPIKKIKISKRKSILTCQIHFNIENFSFKKVDLIEGIGFENLESRWNCFEINLKLNREKL